VLLACTALAACALAAPGRAADPAPEGKPSPVHEDARIAPVPWTIPPPGSCAPSGGARVLPKGDAPPTAFRPGDTFSFEELGALRDFLPPFLWEYRERFFQPGMRLEIGHCFADYGPPDFYVKATAEHAGNRARVVRTRRRYDQAPKAEGRGHAHRRDPAGTASGSRDGAPLLPRGQRR